MAQHNNNRGTDNTRDFNMDRDTTGEKGGATAWEQGNMDRSNLEERDEMGYDISDTENTDTDMSENF